MAYSFSVLLNDLATSPLMRLTSRLTAFGTRVNSTTANFQQGFSRSVRSVDSLNERLQALNTQRAASNSIADISRLGREARNVNREINRLENLPPKSFLTRIREAVTGFGSLVGVVGIFSVIMAGIGAVKSVGTLGMDAEDSKIKFEVLLGSMTKAKTLLSDIRDFANVTPFESTGLRQNAEMLLNFGLSGQKILPTLKMLGDVSGGNQEKLNSMTLAFGQMSSTGRLMGQDLNQMINAGFNPLQIISQNTGISMGRLKDQMEKGQISVKMVEEAFKLATGTGGRFNGMMEKVAQSARGRLSTAMDGITSKLTDWGEKYIVPVIGNLALFADAFFSSFEKAGKILQPFFDTIRPLWDAITGFVVSLLGLSETASGTSTVITFFLDVLKFITPVLTVIVNGVTGFLNILKPVAPLIKIIALVWAGWNIALGIFNILMYANPIGLIIAAIVIVIGLVVTAWNKFETFRAIIMGLWETIKGFATMIKNFVVNAFKDFLKGITGMGEALLAFFSGDFKKAWEVGKNAVANLTGANAVGKAVRDGVDAVKGFKKGYDSEISRTRLAKAATVTSKTTEKAEAATTTKQKRSTAFAALGKADQGGAAGSGKAKSSTDGIIGGGSKLTNITINVAKMQDQIVINTVNSGEGAQRLRQILEEELQRLLGSVSQMQTSS